MLGEGLKNLGEKLSQGFDKFKDFVDTLNERGYLLLFLLSFMGFVIYYLLVFALRFKKSREQIHTRLKKEMESSKSS